MYTDFIVAMDFQFFRNFIQTWGDFKPSFRVIYWEDGTHYIMTPETYLTVTSTDGLIPSQTLTLTDTLLADDIPDSAVFVDENDVEVGFFDYHLSHDAETFTITRDYETLISTDGGLSPRLSCERALYDLIRQEG